MILLFCLMPATAFGQTAVRMLDFVQAHCIQIAPPSVLYDLPDPWTQASRSTTRFWLPSIAVEEGIDYAAFIAYQVEVGQDVPADRAGPLTAERYSDELLDQQSYTSNDWQRLYVHEPTDTHLFIAAGEDTEDPDDWFKPTCYLWHPDTDAALATEIIDRWDVLFEHRLQTPMGHATHAWNKMVVDGYEYTFESRVIRPNTEHADGLAPVILKLGFTDW